MIHNHRCVKCSLECIAIKYLQEYDHIFSLEVKNISRFRVHDHMRPLGALIPPCEPLSLVPSLPSSRFIPFASSVRGWASAAAAASLPRTSSTPYQRRLSRALISPTALFDELNRIISPGYVDALAPRLAWRYEII